MSGSRARAASLSRVRLCTPRILLRRQESRGCIRPLRVAGIGGPRASGGLQGGPESALSRPSVGPPMDACSEGGDQAFPGGPCTRTIPPVPAVRPTVAIRPIEASTVAVRYVRYTSTVDIRSVPMNVCKGSKGPMDLARGREARRISCRNRRPRCARLQTTLADIHHDRSNIACRHEADIPGRRGGMRSLRFSSCQREFRNDGQSGLLQHDPNEINV
jgi:hypothetical protein